MFDDQTWTVAATDSVLLGSDAVLGTIGAVPSPVSLE